MKHISRLNVVPLTAVFLAGCSLMATASAPVKITDSVLTDSAGMTLYTYDRDAAGKSACNGQCASNWPPLLAQKGDTATGDYSVLIRDDGARQWAYKGKPLYRWAKDRQPGDKTGDGFLGFWHVAKP